MDGSGGGLGGGLDMSQPKSDLIHPSPDYFHPFNRVEWIGYTSGQGENSSPRTVGSSRGHWLPVVYAGTQR